MDVRTGVPVVAPPLTSCATLTKPSVSLNSELTGNRRVNTGKVLSMTPDMRTTQSHRHGCHIQLGRRATEGRNLASSSALTLATRTKGHLDGIFSKLLSSC